MTEDARRQLEELYRYQVDAVQRSLARKIGRENAEDLVSRGLIRLAERLEKEPVKNAPALLGTIISGLLKNYWRDKARAPLPVDYVGVEMEASRDIERPATYNARNPDWHAVAVEIMDAITVPAPDFEDVKFDGDFDRAVRSLDSDERDAFILTELRGLPVREAADVLDTSKDTVHRRAEAARNTLKGALSSA